jgi:hypothetical protein
MQSLLDLVLSGHHVRDGLVHFASVSCMPRIL